MFECGWIRCPNAPPFWTPHSPSFCPNTPSEGLTATPLQPVFLWPPHPLKCGLASFPSRASIHLKMLQDSPLVWRSSLVGSPSRGLQSTMHSALCFCVWLFLETALPWVGFWGQHWTSACYAKYSLRAPHPHPLPHPHYGICIWMLGHPALRLWVFLRHSMEDHLKWEPTITSDTCLREPSEWYNDKAFKGKKVVLAFATDQQYWLHPKNVPPVLSGKPECLTVGRQWTPKSILHLKIYSSAYWSFW